MFLRSVAEGNIQHYKLFLLALLQLTLKFLWNETHVASAFPEICQAYVNQITTAWVFNPFNLILGSDIWLSLALLPYFCMFIHPRNPSRITVDTSSTVPGTNALDITAYG